MIDLLRLGTQTPATADTAANTASTDDTASTDKAESSRRRNELLHPTLGCLCAEGRLIDHNVVRFLPGVHDCAYIHERNRRLGLLEKPTGSRAKAHAS